VSRDRARSGGASTRSTPRVILRAAVPPEPITPPIGKAYSCISALFDLRVSRGRHILMFLQISSLRSSAIHLVMIALSTDARTGLPDGRVKRPSACLNESDGARIFKLTATKARSCARRLGRLPERDPPTTVTRHGLRAHKSIDCRSRPHPRGGRCGGSTQLQ
jgi:hypothetical protein